MPGMGLAEGPARAVALSALIRMPVDSRIGILFE